MNARSLRSQRFRAEREESWRELERILAKAERRSIRALTDAELLALPILYRGALSALATARATSLDAALAEYLESLTARAYFFVYGVRGKAGERFVRFLARDLPAAVQGLWRETLISAAIFAFAALVGFFLVSHDPEWFYALISGQETRNPAAPAEYLRKIIYDEEQKEGFATFSTYLFTNNASVALFSFALGFAFCVPTAFLEASNGLMLGAMFAVHESKGLGLEFGGWIIIHGVTEIFAIILACAAGFRIGWAVAFPGPLPRLDAAVVAGRSSAVVMGGVVIMLIFAGLLEGFGRQLITSDVARYSIGIGTGLFWAAWYYLPKRGGPRA